MFTYFRILSFCFILVQSVVGLKCFFGDTGNQKVNITEIEELEDCRGVAGRKLYSYLHSYDDDDLRCFTFVGYRYGVKTLVRKGCLVKCECREVKPSPKENLDSGKCHECNGDGCNEGNSASKYTIFGFLNFALISSIVLTF